MKHQVPHDLGQEKAKQVTSLAFESYAKRYAEYQPTVTWTGPAEAKIAFKVKGMSLSGVVEVSASSIALDLEVPFLLKPFKGTALAVIEEEIRSWINKAKAGQI